MIEIKESDFKSIEIASLKKEVREYYRKHLQGSTVYNLDALLGINLTRKGIEHVCFSGEQSAIKLALVQRLDQVLVTAKRTGWGDKKFKDTDGVVGYVKFSAMVKVFGRVMKVLIVTRCVGKGRNNLDGLSIQYYHHSYDPKENPRNFLNEKGTDARGSRKIASRL